MTLVLSAQSIRRLCYTGKLASLQVPLITPFVERGVVGGRSFGLSACSYDCRIAHDLVLGPWDTALACTVERFCLPNNVCGTVLDKSSYARVFVTAFNTHLDPGWRGTLTCELANLGKDTVHYKEGFPVCQIKFEWLDEPTELPYAGKYQDQPDHPVGALYENVSLGELT